MILLFLGSSNSAGAEPIILSVLASLGVFIGSFIVGVVLGLIFAKITKHVKMNDSPIYETTMLFVFAYTSYLLADVLSLAGIISVFFCGITMAHYSYDNLDKETAVSLKVSHTQHHVFDCLDYVTVHCIHGRIVYFLISRSRTVIIPAKNNVQCTHGDIRLCNHIPITLSVCLLGRFLF